MRGQVASKGIAAIQEVEVRPNRNHSVAFHPMKTLRTLRQNSARRLGVGLAAIALLIWLIPLSVIAVAVKFLARVIGAAESQWLGPALALPLPRPLSREESRGSSQLHPVTL